MRRKVRVKVLTPIKRKKTEHFCYFCGKSQKITKHHIIFRTFGGEKLSNNKEYLCEKCHDKFHILVKPVITLLLSIIKHADFSGRMGPIGFLRTNHIKGGKRNEKTHIPKAKD